MEEFITYMDYLWVQAEDDIITLGINEDGLDGFDSIETINLPTENTETTPGEVCGDLDTDQGPLNLYSPIDGVVIEVNEAVVQNPQLIVEDPYGDGWLIRIEANDPEQISNLADRIKAEDEEFQ